MSDAHAEIERLRKENAELRALFNPGDYLRVWNEVIDRRDHAQAEVKRLRGLLAQLQWAGTYACESRPGCGQAACPVCGVLADSPEFGQLPHEPDCWLADELGRT